MDPLGKLLETVHLGGSLYFRSELGAPWGIEVPPSGVAQFHVVRRGRCWLRPCAGAPFPPQLLEAGDLVVLPHGSAHVLADDRDTPAVPLPDLVPCDLASPEDLDCCRPMRAGGGGAPATLICGFFRFDTGLAHPLLDVLPTVIVLRGDGGRARRWLESSLDLIADEVTAARPGSAALVNRLTEALFIQVLQAYIAEADHASPSWLLGLRDTQVARALGAIHGDPRRDWSVASIAAEVGLSRSAFSARFREMVGEPPLQYLTRWRMQVAANHLRAGRLTLAEVADAVGYGAEASFARVFKRLVGEAPGAFRRRSRDHARAGTAAASVPAARSADAPRG